MRINIFNINEDNLINIIQNLDIVSFICLMWSCKHFYKTRKQYLNFIIEVKKYKKYNNNNLINILLNSYIFIDKIQNDVIYNNDIKNNVMNENKINNTFDIFGYYCFKNMNNNSLFDQYISYYKYFTKVCSNNICQKYNYKYKNLSILFNNMFEFKWYTTNINIFQLYEVAYHVKMKKYKNVYNNLLSLTFKNNKYNIIDTIYFLIQIFTFNYKTLSKFKIIFAYILYNYIDINFNIIYKETNINNYTKDIFINNGNNVLNNIDDLKIPKYIKTLIRNKLLNTIQKLEQLNNIRINIM
jgi:hypothetical protein